jgi:hypothetical protein
MTVADEENVPCSFCKRTKDQVGPIVKGIGAAICGECCKRCVGPDAYVAACAYCEPKKGQHGELCPERSDCA